MGRNHLWCRQGDVANRILAAVGHNSHGLIRWLKLLLYQVLAAPVATLYPFQPESCVLYGRLRISRANAPPINPD
jgi:hypothetical protein